MIWPFGRKTKKAKPVSPAETPQGTRIVRRTEIITEREWTSTVVRRAVAPGSPASLDESSPTEHEN